nr:CUAEP/CCAEP-tail radical SAM protein [Mycobacterium paraintracellulare]
MTGKQVLLVGTYDLGHQPFGLASPAAWLSAAGYDVECIDLSRGALDPERVAAAAVVAFYIPMHTATRLALATLTQVRMLNPTARVCFYGLYGQANAAYLTQLGADAVISGEFEAELVRYIDSVALTTPSAAGGPETPAELADELPGGGPVITALERLQFHVPDRSGLPALSEYAQLSIGESRRIVGYTEATRGCRHTCRHCPVVPVYGGTLRVVQLEVVLADIAAQVGAGAQHITFGDPDFFNAPGHAVRVVSALHDAHPELTYDVTIKIEHLLKHRDLLTTLADTGCLFVTSAVESVDDMVLRYLDKGHSCADFIEAVDICRAANMVLNPTFVAFHPWLTRETLLKTFAVLDAIDIVASVAPIQLTTRLLVPESSLLLDLPELAGMFNSFDPQKLVHPWKHPNPAIDELQRTFEELVADSARAGHGRVETFDRLWRAAGGSPPPRRPIATAAVPQFLEPWFCCSEPVGELLTGWSAPEELGRTQIAVRPPNSSPGRGFQIKQPATAPVWAAPP